MSQKEINRNRSDRSRKTGLHYFLEGFSIMMQPGLKRFVFLPIVVNIFILGGAFIWLYFQIDGWIAAILDYLPNWLHWLHFILWPLILFSIVLVFGYFFSTVANIIASPFNSLLAEKVEEERSGVPAADLSWAAFAKDIPRMIHRELVRLGYYLPRALLILVLSFIPVINIVAPVLWFVFASWMMVIQYCDYAFDNHKISFPDMKNRLGKDRLFNLPFGALVSLLTMIPIINLFIMPAAVCGATAMWVDRYRADYC